MHPSAGLGTCIFPCRTTSMNAFAQLNSILIFRTRLSYLGAVSAIHDAIVLANVLHDLPSKNPDDITRAFQAYKDERYPLAKVSWDTSHKMSQVLGKTWINAMIRFGINHMPDWIWTKALSRMYGYRPQVSFLPLVKDRGSVKPAPQPSLISRSANHGMPQAV